MSWIYSTQFHTNQAEKIMKNWSNSCQVKLTMKPMIYMHAGFHGKPLSFFQWSQIDSEVANLMLWKNIYRYAFEWLTQSMKIFHSCSNAIHSTYYYHFNCWDYIKSIAHSYAKNADVAQIATLLWGLAFDFYIGNIKDKKFSKPYIYSNSSAFLYVKYE